jgi:hypothetical protein
MGVSAIGSTFFVSISRANGISSGMAELQSPVRQGEAKNDRGKATATIWPESWPGVPKGIMLALSYQSDPLRTEWTVRIRAASKAEALSFIEQWLPQAPDQDLMAEAIERLGKEFPGLLPD